MAVVPRVENGGLDCQLSKLEHAVFHAGRNTDPQDIFDKASVWFQEDEVSNPQFPRFLRRKRSTRRAAAMRESRVEMAAPATPR